MQSQRPKTGSYVSLAVSLSRFMWRTLIFIIHIILDSNLWAFVLIIVVCCRVAALDFFPSIPFPICSEFRIRMPRAPPNDVRGQVHATSRTILHSRHTAHTYSERGRGLASSQLALCGWYRFFVWICDWHY